MGSLRLSLVLLREAASNFANSTFRVRGLPAISVIHQVGILHAQQARRVKSFGVVTTFHVTTPNHTLTKF